LPYELGGVVPLTFTALDTTGAPANATLCTLTIQRPWPDGSTDGPFTLAGTNGVYTYNYLTQIAGRHTYRFLATGTPGPGVGVGAQPDVFDVVASTAAGIVSLADAKAMLNIPANVTTFDAKIRQYVRSITGFVERYCGPVTVQQITEREYGGGIEIVLRKPPVIEAPLQVSQIVAMTPVLTYGLIYDLTLLNVDFKTGIMRHTAGLPFIYGPYDLTYWAGRPVVPDEILLGTESILKHQWEQERGGAGRTGAYGADDTTIMWGFAIPNRALEMLEPQRTPSGIA
jgi:hypothetical protein